MNNNSTLNNNFSIKGTSSNTFSMFKGGYNLGSWALEAEQHQKK